MTGTTPRGQAGEREASAWVRSMFGRIAPRYDLANHLLSFNLDRHWRSVTVDRVRQILKQPGTRVLDVCCGTGDLLAALSAEAAGQVFGSDFCHPMLTAANEKLAKRRMPARLFEADALQLPLAAESLDLITVAFGFRNLANYEQGLAEMRRVLRPGGMAAILEFSQPRNPAFAALYGFYSRRVLPVIGGALSGSRDAYEYLPESIGKFPTAEQLAERMQAAGFRSVTFTRMTAGTVALHLGVM
jgi:demethylmenaquinone methyltransferase / 2-methoxy-6-polyprenyl-1,4-benzoquinol methylase